MRIEERQYKILEALEKEPSITVAELARLLFVSEPTVRRDLTELDRKGMITKVYGGAILNVGAADREIPFPLRENEKSAMKAVMGKRASELVQDGMVVMLDGSTSAYHMVPYLAGKKDLIVVTSGAKTAVALAEMGIRTFSTGGQMIIHSFSYVGEGAERFVRGINADVLFFSAAGLTEDGRMSDRSIEEANLRRVMFSACKRRYLLCDSGKFGKTCFYNMGTLDEIDGIVTEGELPPSLAQFFRGRLST